jgi:hypothetical protein
MGAAAEISGSPAQRNENVEMEELDGEEAAQKEAGAAVAKEEPWEVQIRNYKNLLAFDYVQRSGERANSKVKGAAEEEWRSQEG